MSCILIEAILDDSSTQISCTRLRIVRATLKLGFRWVLIVPLLLIYYTICCLLTRFIYQVSPKVWENARIFNFDCHWKCGIYEIWSIGRMQYQRKMQNYQLLSQGGLFYEKCTSIPVFESPTWRSRQKSCQARIQAPAYDMVHIGCWPKKEQDRRDFNLPLLNTLNESIRERT